MSDHVTILKPIYEAKGIVTCEMEWPHDCWHDNGLSFAHRHKRGWYRTQPEKLAEFDQTLLLCAPAHDWIEYGDKENTGRELTEKIFKEKRADEIL
jgi:hypothetical protein